MRDRSDPPPNEPSPAPVGTPAEQSTHRTPAPTPAQHNDASIAKHGPTPLVAFDSAGQCGDR